MSNLDQDFVDSQERPLPFDAKPWDNECCVLKKCCKAYKKKGKHCKKCPKHS